MALRNQRFGFVLSEAESKILTRLAEEERISEAAVIRRLLWVADGKQHPFGDDQSPDAFMPQGTFFRLPVEHLEVRIGRETSMIYLDLPGKREVRFDLSQEQVKWLKQALSRS